MPSFIQIARVTLARVTEEDLPSWHSNLVMGVVSPLDPLFPHSENPTQFMRRVCHVYEIVGAFGEAVRLKHHPLKVYLKGISRAGRLNCCFTNSQSG